MIVRAELACWVLASGERVLVPNAGGCGVYVLLPQARSAKYTVSALPSGPVSLAESHTAQVRLLVALVTAPSSRIITFPWEEQPPAGEVRSEGAGRRALGPL